MPSTPLKKSQTPDGLIIAAIAVGSVLMLAILTQAPILATACVIIFEIISLWIYFRSIRPLSTSPKLQFSNTDMERLRSETLEEITDSLPRAIIALDKSAKIIHANEAAQTMLSPNMVGRPVGAYLRTSSVRPEIERAFNGEIPESLSIHVLQPTERYLDIDFSRAISVQHDNAKDNVVFAVLADRTQAAKAREQRADFLANASHELKTPIASLKGYIETLQGHAKDDPIAREKFLDIMAEQADRMQRLVTDLLSLRSIESSEHIAPSETADLRKAIEAAKDSLDPLAKSRDVTLAVDLPSGTPATTFGKTDECVQLFLNLLENAIKLSPKGSTVRAELKKFPRWGGEAFPLPLRKGAGFRRIVNLAPYENPVWRAVISDNGPGFSRTHLPRIGERFYRVAGDLPAQEKGTGLGLAIVKHIVMRHRAGLFVQSVHGSHIKDTERMEDETSGTSFSVVFAATSSKA